MDSISWKYDEASENGGCGADKFTHTHTHKISYNVHSNELLPNRHYAMRNKTKRNETGDVFISNVKTYFSSHFAVSISIENVNIHVISTNSILNLNIFSWFLLSVCWASTGNDLIRNKQFCVCFAWVLDSINMKSNGVNLCIRLDQQNTVHRSEIKVVKVTKKLYPPKKKNLNVSKPIKMNSQILSWFRKLNWIFDATLAFSHIHSTICTRCNQSLCSGVSIPLSDTFFSPGMYCDHSHQSKTRQL